MEEGGVEEKPIRTATEVQLGFAFFTDAPSQPVTLSRDPATSQRRARTGGTPRNFADALAAVHTLLLEAPIADIDTQLLSVFEFCEAALTRALDVVPIRQGVPFSEEEYRSVRGIGQAQWLLAEAQGKQEMKPVVPRAKKPKSAQREA
jgi:hypothetical protein